MPSQFGHNTLIGQSAVIYAIKSRTRNGFLFIKTAANIFFVSDKFYNVLLVFYSLPTSVTFL